MSRFYPNLFGLVAKKIGQKYHSYLRFVSRLWKEISQKKMVLFKCNTRSNTRSILQELVWQEKIFDLNRISFDLTFHSEPIISCCDVVQNMFILRNIVDIEKNRNQLILIYAIFQKTISIAEMCVFSYRHCVIEHLEILELMFKIIHFTQNQPHMYNFKVLIELIGHMKLSKNDYWRTNFQLKPTTNNVEKYCVAKLTTWQFIQKRLTCDICERDIINYLNRIKSYLESF